MVQEETWKKAHKRMGAEAEQWASGWLFPLGSRSDRQEVVSAIYRNIIN